jgi:hypothetical protein
MHKALSELFRFRLLPFRFSIRHRRSQGFLLLFPGKRRSPRGAVKDGQVQSIAVAYTAE